MSLTDELGIIDLGGLAADHQEINLQGVPVLGGLQDFLVVHKEFNEFFEHFFVLALIKIGSSYQQLRVSKGRDLQLLGIEVQFDCLIGVISVYNTSIIARVNSSSSIFKPFLNASMLVSYWHQTQFPYKINIELGDELFCLFHNYVNVFFSMFLDLCGLKVAI